MFAKSLSFLLLAALFVIQQSAAFDLGGGKIQVLCHPKQVAAGKKVNVNVRYRMDIPREVDIHVDLLNADTKTFYAGETIEMDSQAGETTASFVLPKDVEEPFLWKVFVTPRGEPFPNMMAETGMLISMDEDNQKVIGQCEMLETRGWVPRNIGPVDYVLFTEKADIITPGEPAKLAMDYGLVTAEEGSINFSLMEKWSNEWGGVSKAVPVEKGEGKIEVELDIPEDLDVEKEYYVIAFLGEEGATWEDKLIEERYYNLAVNPEYIKEESLDVTEEEEELSLDVAEEEEELSLEVAEEEEELSLDVAEEEELSKKNTKKGSLRN